MMLLTSRGWLCLILSCSFSAIDKLPALAESSEDPNLRAGMKYYADGMLGPAEISFYKALSQDTNNPLIHYYLGNILTQEHRLEKARQEYVLANQLSPPGRLRDFSQAALANIVESAIDKAQRRAQRLQEREERREARLREQGLAPQPVALAGPTYEVPDQYKTVVQRIQSQTESLLKQPASDLETRRADEAKLQADEYRREAGSLTTVATTTSSSKQRNSQTLYVTPSMAAEAKYMKAELERKATITEQAANDEVRAMKEARQERQEFLQEAANNLAGQFSLQNRPGSAVLKAEGTSLYVRNYLDLPGTPPPTPLTAKAGKLFPDFPLRGSAGHLPGFRRPSSNTPVGDLASEDNLGATTSSASDSAGHQIKTSVKAEKLP